MAAHRRNRRHVEEALLLLILVRRLRLKKGYKKRRIWVHETFQKRRELGEYHKLVRELDSHEDRFFRMSLGQFAEILALVKPKIKKTTTHWRKPISPAERLAVCLRYLSKDGIERCKDGKPDARVDSIIQKAIDIDLRQIGLAALSSDFSKGKTDKIQGPMVLQIQKVRNISAPKANEDSGAAPPLLRLQLTDGHSTVMGIVLNNINKISLSTPPGSKLKITGSVSCNQGLLLLMNNNCMFLGGRVKELLQKWELAKSLYHHTRKAASGAGGPPPWVPFGQRNQNAETIEKSTKTTMKKSLEDPKPKEQTDQDKEFAEQRRAAIQEVNRSKQGQGKTFGGGKTISASQLKEGKGFESNRRGDGGRNSRRGDQDGTKTTERQQRSDGLYRDLNYGGYQPSEREIQQLVSMGFKRDAASNALRKHTGNVDAAVEMLVQDSSSAHFQSNESGRQRQDTRPEHSRGNGRRSRRGGDDEEDASAPPSGPATIFDFLQPKLGNDKDAGSQAQDEAVAPSHDRRRPRNYDKEQPNSVKEAGIQFMHGGDKGQRSSFRQTDRQETEKKDFRKDWDRNDPDQRTGSRRGENYSSRNYATNDSGSRNLDRNYGNKENSNYSDRNSRRYQGDAKYSNSNPSRRDNARAGNRSNDSRGYQESAGNRYQDRSERNSKPRVHQDNRPPRFQKQSTDAPQRTCPDDDYRQARTNQRGERQQLQPPRYANNNEGFMPTRSTPNLKPGDACLARYWEDHQFYNAVLTALHPSGRTCVVLFLEYGNYEEVNMSDVRPVPSQALMNTPQGAPDSSASSLLMSGKGGVFEGPISINLEFRHGGDGMVYTKPRQQREPSRRNVRPTQNFYQPPTTKR